MTNFHTNSSFPKGARAAKRSPDETNITISSERTPVDIVEDESSPFVREEPATFRRLPPIAP